MANNRRPGVKLMALGHIKELINKFGGDYELNDIDKRLLRGLYEISDKYRMNVEVEPNEDDELPLN
eukprot:CAMPEP_0176355558 /NCGR_PEP_ID=MMETSP0126-20121128/13378_1 /TAXON_ID=141414 ORGANISM="Strombidinopsis acuminatum, Strain SPMC142" /NCGR_SAMPLE_ID=MMETSP0126 /ASSEMBLY_ACC=CAM_ASM_000229 /LENGTH=65 /DNA_ID=CAMNT_0017708255 /DNA_START=1668 /DNA_END=1865 /DNA_ORIENTATION=-